MSGPDDRTLAGRDELATLRSVWEEALPAYEIGEQLGSGACGVVMAGRHRQMGREVAIKFLWSRFGAESEIGNRFKAEARMLGSFDHPHVVRIFDYVEIPGLCGLIMERLTGGTVNDRIGHGGVAPQTACAVVVATCAGLEYAHGLGVLHRDIKPQNLLLSADGILKVADFGIAKVVAGATAMATQPGYMLGTPAYMSPEQVQSGELSPAVDVYAAGTVLYELLCGDLPFPVLSDPLAAMYQRVHEEPVPLLEKAPALPKALAAVTDRALRPAAADRYPSAAELAGAVVRAAEEEWGANWMADADLALDPAATAPPRRVARPVPAVDGPLERHRELQGITEALTSAAAGAGRLIVIEGPPGIGKTRLVQETRALAKARGFGRLQAIGDELEQAMPWSVVRQMVERSISRYHGEVREALLAGPSGAALAALDSAPAEAGAGDAEVARTLHALWWVAADLASFRPLLITVDDAQWADLPSLRFLEYLSRRIADLPIALVVATRPPRDRSGPLAELSAGRSGERILPRPLSHEAVAAMCLGRGGGAADEVVTALHTVSGGNPFLAGAVLDELDVRGLGLDDPGTAAHVQHLGPSTISRAVLTRLPPDASTLAGAAAVLGARADPRLAAGMVDLHGPRLAEATDALVTGHVLASGEEQLVFVHPVVREAVLGELGPRERAELHATAAQALHAAGAPVARVAAHVAAAPAGALRGSAALLRQAAAELLADGDPATAAAYLTMAFDETPEDEGLQAQLGAALMRTRDWAQAREHLRAAAESAPTLRDRAERLAAAAAATSAQDGPRAAIAELREALETWPEPDPDRTSLVLEARLATICSLLPDESRQIAMHLQRFARLPGRTRDERTLLALLGQRQRYDGHPARDVAAILVRALGSGAYLEDVADNMEGMVGWVVALTALSAADAIAPATAEIARAKARVRERGSPVEFGMVTSAAVVLAWRTGDVSGAEAESDAVLAAVAAENPSANVIAMRASATHFSVWAALERGGLEAAAKALSTFDVQSAGGPRVIPAIWLREGRAALALASGDPARAYDEAMAMGDEVRTAHLDIPTISWRVPAALASERLGRGDEARALATELLELARRWGALSDIGAALRLVAQVDPERRLELLQESLAVLESSPARLELARTLVELGEALRAARRRKQAQDPLRRGAELAAACGARVLHRRAAEALTALGESSRRLTLSGPGSLSARERLVAQLAVEGRSDREIAQELFVTPRTVENHIKRVCAKLGIAGRGQLPSALGVALTAT